MVPGGGSARLGLAVLGLVLVAYFSLRFDTFATTDNALIIALGMSSIAIAVIGTSVLLVSGNVDLSIGSMYALIAVTVGEVASHTQNLALALAAGIVMGALLGAINGTLVRLLKINPLIVTLAMLAVYGGFAYVVSGGESVYGFSDSFLEVGRAGFGKLTTPIITAAVLFVIVGFWLVHSRTGLRIYAIGGDVKAAERNGISVGRTVLGLYTLNGMLIGIVAILTTARLGSASPSLGTGFELEVLTAAILGGVAFSGGSGRPLGVFFGVAVIGIINAGLVFEGIDDYYQQIARGMLLLLALGADQFAQFRRERRATREGASSRLDALRAKLTPRLAGGVAAADGSLGAAKIALDRAEQRAVKREPDDPELPLLEARDIGVRYGSVLALEAGSISVRSGEVVALLGDNGAGKSSLIKVLSGAIRPTHGELRLHGKPVSFHSPHDAREASVQTVYQDLALCPNLSVAHNLILGDEPMRRLFGLIPVRDDQLAVEQASAHMRELGIKLKDQGTLVEQLSGGQRQSVAIARAVRKEVGVVLLDEPTAALGVTQTRNVLDLIRSIAARGTGVILISHDIETICDVAERVVVLRLGKMVHEGPIDEVSQIELLHLMAGVQDERPVART